MANCAVVSEEPQKCVLHGNWTHLIPTQFCRINKKSTISGEYWICWISLFNMKKMSRSILFRNFWIVYQLSAMCCSTCDSIWINIRSNKQYKPVKWSVIFRFSINENRFSGSSYYLCNRSISNLSGLGLLYTIEWCFIRIGNFEQTKRSPNKWPGKSAPHNTTMRKTDANRGNTTKGQLM